MTRLRLHTKRMHVRRKTIPLINEYSPTETSRKESHEMTKTLHPNSEENVNFRAFVNAAAALAAAARVYRNAINRKINKLCMNSLTGVILYVRVYCCTSRRGLRNTEVVFSM